MIFAATARLDGNNFTESGPPTPLFATPDGILYTAPSGVENIDSPTPEQLAIPGITDTQMRDGFTTEDFPDVAKAGFFTSSVMLYNTIGSEFRATDGAQVNFDARGAPASGEAPASAAFPMLYNGGLTTAGYDRMRTVSEDFQSTAAITTVPPGALPVANVGNWTSFANGGDNVQVSTTRAAPGVGLRHVCTSIVVTRERTNATQGDIEVNLRDSTSGLGNILYSFPFNNIIDAGVTEHFQDIVIPNLSIVGADNGAMTLEFDTTPGVGSFGSVAMTGYTIG